VTGRHAGAPAQVEGAGNAKRWLVDLTETERAELEALTRRGNAPARKIAHARVLLLAHDGLTDEDIAVATGRSRSPVERTRRRVQDGLETLGQAAGGGSSQAGRARPGHADRPGVCESTLRPHRLDDAVAGRCTRGASGGAAYFRRIGAQSTQKNGLKPWLQEHWCIPEVSPSFLAAMEDVFELYAEPYDPDRPVVGFDERPSRLVAETRTSMPALPAQPRRIDYAYRRNGTCDLFTAIEPLSG
jgi:Homeodomain-like domain-containing protein